ncbi:MAG: hypothetical protein EPO68_04660 [Planctomycetota bacterium]|nr:MAG: hypothetical protein EPO68_04660 [Planctomycetota bacterium]
MLIPCSTSHGHGGTYRGPGDTIPPGGAGTGGGAGTPTGPTNPGSLGTGTTGSGTAGTPGGSGDPTRSGDPFGDPRTTMPGGVDLTQWTFWWEFNKDAYLQLKRATRAGLVSGGEDVFNPRAGVKVNDTLRPTDAVITQSIVPALLAALRGEDNNDIATGCMMALAKIGDTRSETGESPIQQAITPFLRSRVQEISETAVIALGMLAAESAVPTLIDLLEDTPAGRELIEKREVDYRTRAYAAYGLALCGRQIASLEIQRQIVEALFRTIESDRTSTRDVQVACIIALGLVPIDEAAAYEPAEGSAERAKGEVPRTFRRGQVQALARLLDDPRRQDIARAHVPVALARLCKDLKHERFQALKSEIAPRLLALLTKEAREKPLVVQSAVYALGLFADDDADALDASIRRTLIDATDSRMDDQARYFSRIALAYAASTRGDGAQPGAGVEEVLGHFTAQLAKSAKANLDSWNSIGAGVLGRRLAERGEPAAELGEALRAKFEKTTEPKEIGALAIALGILGESESGRALAKRLKTGDDEALGYVCIALGMLQSTEAKPQIDAIVERSRYKADVLKQSAIALGLLGDKSVGQRIVAMLDESRTLAARAALVQALGLIGDRESVPPLVELLGDRSKPAIARGFAAAALGTIADKSMLPWNNAIAVDINYRASTETLNKADAGTGVLNLL